MFLKSASNIRIQAVGEAVHVAEVVAALDPVDAQSTASQACPTSAPMPMPTGDPRRALSLQRGGWRPARRDVAAGREAPSSRSDPAGQATTESSPLMPTISSISSRRPTVSIWATTNSSRLARAAGIRVRRRGRSSTAAADRSRAFPAADSGRPRRTPGRLGRAGLRKNDSLGPGVEHALDPADVAAGNAHKCRRAACAGGDQMAGTSTRPTSGCARGRSRRNRRCRKAPR